MLGDDPLAVLRLGDVRRDGRGAELLCRRLDPLGPARDEGQLEAFVPQHSRDREPDARRAAGDECSPGHWAYSKRRGDRSGRTDEPHRRRRVRGEVLGRAARGSAQGLRPGGGGGSARRPRSGGRRGRLPARCRAGARLHGRLLSPARRRPRPLRPHRGDERAQRRLRDGRHAAARALDRGLSRGAADRSPCCGLRRSGRAGARGRRDPRRRSHDPRCRAKVRPRRRRHCPSGRRVGQERGSAGGRRLPHEAARDGSRTRREGRPRRGGALDDDAERRRGGGAAAVHAPRGDRRDRLRALRTRA